LVRNVVARNGVSRIPESKSAECKICNGVCAARVAIGTAEPVSR
jgi:hypothetical protein